MRKHGWQLPYHPLQVVAMAVFVALGFAYYVFFAPFVGKQLFQYIAMGIYTPIIACAFGLYIWCAIADPSDPGVFRSKKYLHILDNKKRANISEPKREGETGNLTPSVNNAVGTQDNTNAASKTNIAYLFTISGLALCPFYVCRNSCKDSADQQGSEEGLFYCSLCEVEVFKYSKHCRVCDKCVDCFDHHCRWINNCIGKRNYPVFFTLMVFALLMVILQWLTGILVLILCFLNRKHFAATISSKLGTSFTVVPFAIVVVVCTLLAMVATLPLAQLFCFHVLLIKKGISTYDYIVALREQEQEATEGQHSPQMSMTSSITGLSSASSFNNFQRAAWCTPPRLFVEDQFDAIPPDNASVSSLGIRVTTKEEPSKKKNSTPIKISPWALARLNSEDVSRAAAEARKKSKILRPAVRSESTSNLETNRSFGNHRRKPPRLNYGQSKGSKRIHLPVDTVDCETGQTFRKNRTIPNMVGNINYSSSPESSLGSPEIRPLRASSSGAEAQKEIPLSRSSSDGYDASGGEDSDHNPTRILHRSVDWSSHIHGADQDKTALPYVPSECRED